MIDGDSLAHYAAKGCLTIGGIVIAIALAGGIVLGFLAGWSGRLG